eukprot:UN29541
MTGVQLPKPMTHWLDQTNKDVKIDGVMRYNLEKCNFKKPTPIQKYSVPVVFAQRNLMACAQTGSGKTGAFLIPTFCLLKKAYDTRENKEKEVAEPRCVVFSPTRELAQQIHTQARKFLYCMGMRAVCIFGGSDKASQERDLRDGGVEIFNCNSRTFNRFL